MKHKLSAILIVTILSLPLFACSEEPESSEPQEKVYVKEDEIKDVFSSPDKYEGKYIKLSGKVFTEPEKDGDDYALQAWNNPQNSENDFVVHYTGKDDLKVDDYIVVDGKITGEFEGENFFGSSLTCPLIDAESIEVQSYIDAIVPTLKEITPNISNEQHDLTITIDKVEYAEIETRVYLTVTNNGNDNVGYGVYSTRIVQDGKQIEQDQSSSSSYEGNYEELSYDLIAGASTSGVLVFPSIDQTKDFKIVVPDIYSDNYELEFEDFSFDISAN